MRRTAYILDARAAPEQTTFRLDAYPGSFTQVFVNGLLRPPSSYELEGAALTLAEPPGEGAEVLVVSGQGGSFTTADHVDQAVAPLAREESVAARLEERHEKGRDVLLPKDPTDEMAAVPLQMLRAITEGVPKEYVDEILQRFYTRNEIDPQLAAKLDAHLLGEPDGAARNGPDGKLLAHQLPRIAITEPFVAESETEMLSLETQVGDVVRRTDLSRTFMRSRRETGTMEDWVPLSDPSSGRAEDVSLEPVEGLAARDVQSFAGEYRTRHRSLRESLDAEITARHSHGAATGENVHLETPGSVGAAPEDHDHPEYPAGDTTGATDGHVWTFDGASGGWLPKDSPPAHKGSHATGAADAIAPADIGAAPSVRTISTTAPLTGGGNLTADRALDVSNVTTSARGVMLPGDKAKLDAVRPNDAYASLKMSADPSIQHATWTTLPLDVVSFDGRGWLSSTPGDIFVDADGLYLLWAYVRWATSNTSGNRLIRFNSNRQNVIGENVLSASVDSVGRGAITLYARLTAGERVRAEVNQTSGTTLDVSASNSSVVVARIM